MFFYSQKKYFLYRNLQLNILRFLLEFIRDVRIIHNNFKYVIIMI